MTGSKICGIIGLALCLPFIGVAQGTDTLNYFTRGDITKKVFEAETIEIRPECNCVGVCCCENTAADEGRQRFSAADEVLSQITGITLIKRGNYAFEPVLNGMGANRMNLTIDGMKIFPACTDKMDPVTAYVETNNLESFSVQSGAGGGEFGSAIAGSIDMKTNGPRIRPNTPFSGEMGAGYSSAANGLTGLMSLNHSGKKYAVALSGVYRKSQNYRAGGGAIIPFSQFEKWNGSVSALYLLGKKDLLKADVIIDDAYNVGYPALPMDVAFAKARIYGITHRHTLSEGIVKSLETKVYANSVAHAMDDTHRPDVFMHMDMPGWTKTYGVFSRAHLQWKKHDATLKVEGYHTNARAEMTMHPLDEAPMLMLTWPDVDKYSIGLYAEDQWKVSDKDLVKLGFRIETLTNNVRDQMGIEQATVFDQDLTGSDRRWMPSVNTTYQRRFGDDFRGWVAAGYSERAPSVTEQYAYYIFNSYDGYDYIGQVNLLNERAIQSEMGVEGKFDAFDLRGTAFFYHMYDYIFGTTHPEVSPMTHSANGVKMYVNMPNATMTGATLQLGYSLDTGLSLSSQFSYVHGSDDKGNPLPSIPAMSNQTKARFGFKHNFVEVAAQAATAQKRVDESFGEKPSPGYAVFHIRGGTYFEWEDNRLSINAGIENLLDTKYHDHLDWGGIARPGRNVYLNLAFKF